MMRHLASHCGLVVALVALAACGADGPPTPPPAEEERQPLQSGLTISGSVGVGVSGGSASGRVRNE